MQPRNIILAIAGLAVLGVLALLLLEVSGDSEPDLSAEKRAKALAEYERRKAMTDRMADRLPTSGDRSSQQRPKPSESRRRPSANERVERMRPPSRGGRPSGSRFGRRGGDGETAADPRRASKDGKEADPMKVRMTEATRFYDKGNYPAAQEVALEILEKDPGNIKMLRVAVSTLCATGDVDRAVRYLNQLPAGDQNQMRKRCEKWGAELE